MKRICFICVCHGRWDSNITTQESTALLKRKTEFIIVTKRTDKENQTTSCSWSTKKKWRVSRTTMEYVEVNTGEKSQNMDERPRENGANEIQLSHTNHSLICSTVVWSTYPVSITQSSTWWSVLNEDNNTRFLRAAGQRDSGTALIRPQPHRKEDVKGVKGDPGQNEMISRWFEPALK